MSNEKQGTGRLPETLPARWLGRPCHYLPQTASTNSTLVEMAAAGAPAGTLVLTDFQTAGRGRLGRRWEAPPGTSLLFSLLFRPPWPAEQASWLTMIAGIASARVVRAETGLDVALKWPNDLMARTGRGWHKIGGLLLETALAGKQLDHAVLGIGLNVNIPPAQLPAAATPATSILALSGQETPRLHLLNRLLAALEEQYEGALGGCSPREAWAALLLTQGRPVTVQMGSTTLHGLATGTDEWGRLLVRDVHGKLHAVAAGEVTLRQERG